MGENKVTKLDIGLVVADFLFSTRGCQKAIDLYKECQILLDKSEDECWNFNLAAILHLQLARVYLIKNEYREVFANLQEGLKNSIKAEDGRSNSMSRYQLGVQMHCSTLSSNFLSKQTTQSC